jgi:hypothetical protein
MLGAVVILFLAVPYFRKHQGMRILAGRQRRIAASPFASLADLMTEETVGLVAAEASVPLGGGAAQHELVAFVHPSCAKCDAMLKQLASLSEADLVRVSVGLAPKDEGADHRLCTTVMAAGLAGGPQVLQASYGVAKKNLRRMLDEDPLPLVAESSGLAPEAIRERLPGAAALAHEATRLVDAHAEGTPALFFDGRPFHGELTHLVWLLEQHPQLLDDPATRLQAVREGSTS